MTSYVCSKNIVDYEHFGAIDSGRCPLHEDVENRHSQEVQKAADEAMAKVRAENPGVSDADLMIQVSDQVKRAEDARKGRARAEVNAFPYHMVENQLRRLPPAIVQQGWPPVPAPPPAHQYVPANPYPVAAAPGLFQPVPIVPQVPMPLYHDAMGPAHLQPHQYVWYNHFPHQHYIIPYPHHYYHRPPNPFH
jgi:TRIAD3 protein (E3 ubiquitin-protein ligase RNF216)